MKLLGFHSWILFAVCTWLLTVPVPTRAQLPFKFLASSADGSELVASGNSYIYTSSDGGTNWWRTSAPSNSWDWVASSADGRRLIAEGTWQGAPFISTSADSGARWSRTGTSYGPLGMLASSDATRLVALNLPQGVYSSTNYGRTWTFTSSTGIDDQQPNWSAFASSADLTTLVAASSDTTWVTNGSSLGGGFIFISTNSGRTWRQTNAPTNSWGSVACSADGALMIGADGGYGDAAIYTSTNSGLTWMRTACPRAAWNSVACSADGQVLVAGAVANWDAAKPAYVVVSQDSGASWRPLAAPLDFISGFEGQFALSADGGRIFFSSSAGNSIVPVAVSVERTHWRWSVGGSEHLTSSADGTKLAAASGAISISSDSGATWMQSAAPINSWSSIGCSVDGTKLVAAAYNDSQGNPGGVFTSSDCGATWRQTSAPSNGWISVACSADGIKLAATASDDGRPHSVGQAPPGQVFISADSGTTWVQTGAPSNFWSSVACSADGTKLLAAARMDSQGNAGQVFISRDAGATWRQTSLPPMYWTGVACSSDGSKFFGCASPGGVYLSSDGGVTWNHSAGPPTGVLAIAASGDGRRLVLRDDGGVMYSSVDAGATWIAADPAGVFWITVALPRDGNQVVAASRDWTAVSSFPFPPAGSQRTAPRLRILTRPGPQLTLSWLVPSTAYRLQQTTDFSSSNWMDVTAAPFLDSSNLNYEVPVTAPSGSHFYRLKMQ